MFCEKLVYLFSLEYLFETMKTVTMPSLVLFSQYGVNSAWAGGRIAAPIELTIVESRADSASSLSAPRRGRPHGIVIEADGEGEWSRLKQLAARFSKQNKLLPLPLFLALEKASPDLCTLALRGGADEILTAGLSKEETQARIVSRIASSRNPSAYEPIEIGTLRLDRNRLCAKIDDREIVLTLLEFELLALFARCPEKILSRAEILESIWMGTSVSPRTIDAHISCLRRKLPSFEYDIGTVYGAGYIFARQPQLSIAT